MKRIPLLPNAITAFGLTCGLFVIFRVNMVDPGETTYNSLLSTAGLLLLAAMADVLDGAVARALKMETDFGSFFDSLSDAVTFGVAPSVVIMKTLVFTQGSHLSFLVTMAALVYSLCGILRLVRFTVTAQQAKSDEHLMADHKKSFTGLPIPAAAGAAVATNLFLASPEFTSYLSIAEPLKAILLSCVMLILGYFMISRWKFPSIKTLQIKVTSFSLTFVFGCVAAAIFWAARYYPASLCLLLSWGYLTLGWILSMVRIFAGRRTKSLEDFEPEVEELE